MTISAMQMARAMARSYFANAAAARLRGDVASAEHYAHVADHYLRVYRAERAKCIEEADSAMKETA